MNSFAFTGFTGRDGELRSTSGGDSILSFSVAVKSGFGKSEKTTWVNCTVWGKRADSLAPHITKGQLVGIVGEACLRPWKGKEGNEKQSLEVRVNDLTLLGKSDSAPKQEQREAPKQAPSGGFDDFESDIPF